MINWIVLISFRPHAPEEIRQKIFDMYQTLADDCGGEEAGILSWRVDHNEDLRKGVHLVEIATFRDSDAIANFRAHPRHGALTDILRDVADWQIGRLTAKE